MVVSLSYCKCLHTIDDSFMVKLEEMDLTKDAPFSKVFQW